MTKEPRNVGADRLGAHPDRKRCHAHKSKTACVGTLRDLQSTIRRGIKKRGPPGWGAKDDHFPVAQLMGLSKHPEKLWHGMGFWKVGRKFVVVSPCQTGVTSHSCPAFDEPERFPDRKWLWKWCR